MDLDWKAIASTVGKTAPILGTLLGGPAGGAVGSLIAAVLGTGATPDAVQQAIASDPAKALELAKYESDNRVKLQQMLYAHVDNLVAANTATIQAEVQDRESAREASVSGGTAFSLFWLSVLLLVGCIGTEIAILFHGLPEGIPDLISGRILGYLDSISITILAFWYGTSASSARKDTVIAAQMAATNLPATTGTGQGQ